jgi:hypothetical protein
VQGCEKDVLVQTAGVGFDSLQNARVERMEKIAVAQEKANHFRASFENSPGLRIGAKPETADCFEYPGARFPAYLRTGVEHSRNGSDAYTCRAGYFANRRFCWNRFHSGYAFSRLWVLSHLAAKDLPTICTTASLAHRSACDLKQCNRVALRSPLPRMQRTSSDEVILQDSVLTDASCSATVWNQFQHFAPRVAAGEWGVR